MDNHMFVNYGQNKNRLFHSSDTAPIIMDLRAKLHTILFGDRGHPGEGRKVLIRSMIDYCVCVKEEEGQKHREADPLCSICKGDGFIYRDYVATAWKSLIDIPRGILDAQGVRLPGMIDATGFSYYFEWDVPITKDDKIFEINLNDDGTMPLNLGDINHLEKFQIKQLIILRADNGRVEYKQAICVREGY
jgi:hypothetical protein